LKIKNLKINPTKLVFFILVLDYNFIRYKQEIVLKIVIDLLTFYVNLKLTDYQAISFNYQQLLNLSIELFLNHLKSIIYILLCKKSLVYFISSDKISR
jgi:hypothetical protein